MIRTTLIVLRASGLKATSSEASEASELVAFRPEARKTIKILQLWPANVKKHLN